MDTVLINEVVGTAWVRNADGSLTQIRQGMRVSENAEIMTENGARVVVAANGAPMLTIGENREFLLSADIFNTEIEALAASMAAFQATDLDPQVAQVLAALESGVDPFEVLDPTAAVLSAAGDGAGGSSFTRLASILETTIPLALEYPSPSVDRPDAQILGATVPAGTTNNTIIGGTEPETPVVPEPVEPEVPVEPETPVVPEPDVPVDPETPVDPEPGIPVEPEEEFEPELIAGVITLESPETMIEGEPYEIIARVDSPVTGSDLLIELSNGSIIVIPVGETEGRVTVDSPRIDDAYIQGDIPSTVTITGTTGGNYSELDTSSTTTTVIVDDNDLSTVTLEGPETVVEGQPYEVIARVDNPVTGSDLIITLDNGQTITIPVGQSTGSVTISVRSDDELVQGDIPQSVGISTVTGGNYERLEFDDTPVTTVVLDNDVPVITVNDVLISEGETGTFKVGFGKPVDNDTTVTLSFEHQTTDQEDIDFTELPVVTIGGEVVEVTANGDGTFSFTLPANTFEGVTVTTPKTVDDDVFEGEETFTLTVTQTGSTLNGTPLPGNITDTGTATVVDDGREMPVESEVPVDPETPVDPENPVDPEVPVDPEIPTANDDHPKLTIGDILVSEGDKAVFGVTLSNPIANESTLTLNINTSPDKGVGFAGINDLWEGGEELGAIEVQLYNADGSKGDLITVEPNAKGEYVVTVPELTTKLDVIIPTHDDEIYEGPESFILEGELSGSVGNVDFSGITDTGTGTIVDDGRLMPVDPTQPLDPETNPEDPNKPAANDDRPSLTIDEVTVTEGTDEYAIFTVSLSNQSVEEISFDLALADGTAKLDDDYAGLEISTDGGKTWTSAISGTIAAGETELLVRTKITDDNQQESDETFTLTATVTDGTVKKAMAEDGSITVEAVGTIIDDDLLTLTVADAGLVSEGSLATFIVNLKNAVDADTTMTLTLGHVDTNDADFNFDLPTITLPNGMVATDVVKNDDGTYSFTVPAGVSGAFKVDLPTQGDDVFEGPEDFTLTAELSGQTAGETDIKGKLTDSGEGTIVDDGRPVDPADPDGTKVDDDRPALAIKNAETTEGGWLNFDVSLTNKVDFDSKVTMTLKPGTALAEDLWKSGDQFVNVIFGNVTTKVSVTPNDEGGFTFEVDVPEGEQNFTVAVPSVDDNIVEATESFTLDGQWSGTLTVGGDEVTYKTDSVIGTGTILDNDDPTLTITNPTVSEGSVAEFVITIGGGEIPVKTDLTFKLGKDNDTADFEDLWGKDWKQDGAERTVTIIVGEGDTATTHENVRVDTNGTFILEGVPAGTTKIIVAVPTANDEVYEGEEKFTLDVTLTGTVEGDGNRKITLDTQGEGTILDDGTGPVDPQEPEVPADNDRPELKVTGGGVVAEGQPAIFNVTLSNATKNDVDLEFDFFSHLEKGASLSDIEGFVVTYTNSAGELVSSTITGGKGVITVPAGITDLEVTIKTKADSIFEGAEGFDLVVTDKSGVTKNGSDSADAFIVDVATDAVVEAGVKEQGGNPNAEYTGTDKTSGNVLDGSAAVTITAVNGVINSDEWTITNDYGTVTINADGTYSYLLNNDSNAVNQLAQGVPHKENFTYTVTGEDGTSVDRTLTITITGTNDKPVITSAEQTHGLIEKGALNEDSYKDGEDNVVSGALKYKDLDSDGDQGTWSVVKGLGLDNNNPLNGLYGTLQLNADGTWTYALENDRPATEALGVGKNGQEVFTVRITDKHGAYSEQDIVINIEGTNDAPTIADALTKAGIEDSAIKGNVLDDGNATDYEGDSLEVISFTINGTKYDAGTTVTLDIGSFVLGKDGAYSFTPQNLNFSGKVPTVEFTIQESGKVEGDALKAHSKLDITVTPVADAPIVTITPIDGVFEDPDPIALNLTLPIITDKESFSNDNEDHPERLGPIGLVLGHNFKEGDVLKTHDGGEISYKGGEYFYTKEGGESIKVPHSIYEHESGNKYDSLQFFISDDADYHLNGIEKNAFGLTKEQFESLTLQPQAHDGDNRTFGVETTSYEVDSQGDQLKYQEGDVIDAIGTPAIPGTLIPGAPSIDYVTIDIKAVTDPVKLNFTGSGFETVDGTRAFNINEDTSFNLSKHLEAKFEDLDGSEERWIEISGLPIGAIVNGTTVTAKNPIVRVDAKADQEGQTGSLTSFPDIKITPPKDFSGVMNDVKVTLKAKDTDKDSDQTHIKTEESSVSLNFNVAPVAGDVAAGNVTTDEDTAVDFMRKLRVTDDNKDGGKEVITAVTIKGIPAGWVLKAPNGDELNLTDNGDGTFSYKLPQTIVDLKEWDQYTLTPPAHSSKDANIKLSVTSVDTNTVNGQELSSEVTKDLTVKVTVNPVAEKIGSDTDGDGIDDLTMTTGHNYENSISGEEDKGFALNISGEFDLKAGWSNQDKDGSEKTFALLNPKLVAGQEADNHLIGTFVKDASFTYNDGTTTHTVTYNAAKGGYLIPMDYLDTVVFTPPKNIAGKFDIKVEAHTVDKDVDSNKVSEATSGGAWLTGITITPVADQATLSVQSVHIKEDTTVDLVIRPSSTDASETFNVKISGLDAGSKLTYGEVDLEVSADGTVTIENFNSNIDLTLTPPKDSNVDMTLKVEAQTVDTWNGVTSESGWTSQDLNVWIKGVADEAILELKGAVGFTEQDLDDGKASITLDKIIKKAELTDKDGSETLSLKITGLPEGFEVVGATFMGGSGDQRVWVFDADNLEGISITAPKHYSGQLPGSIAAVTTENDGDSLTGTAINFADSITITPSPESVLNDGSVIREDEAGKLNFSLDLSHGDTNEELTAVYISVESVEGLTLRVGGNLLTATEVIDGKNYYVISKEDLESVTAQASPNFAHNDGGDFKLDVRYKVTDYSNDGKVDPVSVIMPEQEYAISITPVTDRVEVVVGGESAGEVVVEKGKEADLPVKNDGTTTTITLDLSKVLENGEKDYDGSEQLTQVIVSGLPAGMLVTDLTKDGVSIGTATMLSEGKWLITVNSNVNFTDDFSVDLSFKAGPYLVQGDEGKQITVEVVTQDKGAANTESDSITLIVKPTITTGEGPGNVDSVDISFEATDFKGTEDTAFKLSDVVTATLNTQATEANFSVVIKLPEGAIIKQGDAELASTKLGEDEVWVISGTGGQAALDALLAGLEMTPPKDWNNEVKGDLPIDITFNAYLDNGSTSSNGTGEEDLPIIVDPVTDKLDVSVIFENAQEGENIGITVTLANKVDAETTLSDGSTKVKLTGDYTGGELYYVDADGREHKLTLENGTYTVPVGAAVLANGGELDLNLFYKPSDGEKFKGGDSFAVEVSVSNTEGGSQKIETSSGSASTTVAVVNNGYDVKVVDATGSENQGDGKASRIQLTIQDDGLVDSDGSEQVHNALINGLPEGFLVYVGADAATATLAKNAGSDGDGGNNWSLGLINGELPEYIAIEPPKNWNGTLEGIELVVLSGEKTLSVQKETTAKFDLEVVAKADGITDSFKPQAAFGTEGDIIALNLNIAMKDSKTGNDAETATITLAGLGQYAAFYANGELLNADYVADNNGTYTLTGLTQEQVNNLGFRQAANAVQSQIEVGVSTVDGTDLSTPEATGSFNLSITPQKATSGNDSLLYSGQSLDGLAGTDTVYLRLGEDLDFSTAAAHLKNIETIDLTREGHSHTLSGLGLDQMKTMFGNSGTLTIKGDGDKVGLVGNVEEGLRWVESADNTYVLTQKDEGADLGYKTLNYTVKIEGTATVDGVESAFTKSSTTMSLLSEDTLLIEDADKIEIDDHSLDQDAITTNGADKPLVRDVDVANDESVPLVMSTTEVAEIEDIISEDEGDILPLSDDNTARSSSNFANDVPFVEHKNTSLIDNDKLGDGVNTF